MTSTNPHEIIDEDDDGFDWEAAVREIDVACQNTKPSTSGLGGSSNFAHDNTFTKNPNVPISKSLKKPGTSRQCTLDKFVGKKEIPRSQSENVNIGEGDQNCFPGDDGVSCIDIAAEAAKTWIYPVNVPLRDYQFAITKSALFSNTLVALPTGLGKTLIAAVVMYNYFRWFPSGKIVFAAPSRPLVMQQIEACHSIVGIPQEWTIDMTGQISPPKRASFWQTKRVFFVTPQVLEKDIQSGTCLVKHLVCLVIDEAHRAMGNFSYCVVIRQLMAVPVQLRILALTATPGSKQKTIQNVIDNLHISTLEYRTESDPDVFPYVHDRKIELIQVAMGQDAVDINNKLLEVIRPIVVTLSAFGVIQNRDYHTMSPNEIINMRERFRQVPPPDLAHIKYGEVEGSFGVLISLCYLRKLLSSHGIRPAYEMLDRKLKQGHFAKYMGKNESFHRAKLLMQQSLSHGAPSPKLSKMLEVLIEHFKSRDPQNSRVIIFSNYRESIRDIMDALANIGESVRAAQFIGQSSGKTMKGQSQKVQQAVLERFRSGGYNVIVATSIGEEGLDIMEVDLVICFDANLSPLRMIQRMGRTGRKHDGRVVVLACEGTELNGYMRKQANIKSIRKHMRNGGTNSFSFHSSPRMIPHVFKPEVQFVEMSIEQFIPRGKKPKEAYASQTPVFKDKLSNAEVNLLETYFHPPSENTWRPSLIAFPHFQTIPSRVNKVMHSYRTSMLIDTMQYLQGLSFAGDCNTYLSEEVVSSEKSRGFHAVEDEMGKKDSPNSYDYSSDSQVLDSKRPVIGTSGVAEKQNAMDSCAQNGPEHLNIFGSDFVSVGAGGKVLIVSVPLFSLDKETHPNHTSGSSVILLNCLKQESCNLRIQNEDEQTMQAKKFGIPRPPQTCCQKRETQPSSRFCDLDEQQDKICDTDDLMPMTPISQRNISNEDCAGEMSDHLEIKASSLLVDAYNNNIRDAELSPRLTNLIKSGVVPESPIDNCDCASPVQLHAELIFKASSPGEKEKVAFDGGISQNNVSTSPVNTEIQTPLLKLKNCANIRGCIFNSPTVDGGRHSYSEDSRLSSGEKSTSVKPVRKFKRLRKAGECGDNRNQNSMKENSFVHTENLVKSFSTVNTNRIKHDRGRGMLVNDVRDFIEEEAEVSSEADMSDDEEEEDDNSYDSFIDDRMNLTATTSQPESSRPDMMAIYRRSLLSQSPIVRQPNLSITFSPDCASPMTKISETGSSLDKTLDSLQTPQTGFANQSAVRGSESFKINQNSCEVVPCTTSTCRYETEMESGKRKLSFYQSGSIPIVNLECEFALQSDKESMHGNAITDEFCDDDIYDGLDLDELEAQATLLLRQKSDLPTQKQETASQTHGQLPNLISSPSFDLGI
ncbi:DEAD/DEAH box RNA helicase family protein [Quillaja saponaria]|uniref:DEAD/DEAH box RNA helicase family protein n=1 Tax=Quillaja saponaria TaxID=32244 RepID=A0AAD7L169_QUISA|nr:DEAD/DEAH box RNA helicase family protein [Quillaja saponaria]